MTTRTLTIADAAYDVMWVRVPSNYRVLVGRVELFGQVGIAAYLASLGHEVVCPEHRYWERGHNRQSDKRPVRLIRKALWPGYLPVRWQSQTASGDQKNGIGVDAKALRWFIDAAPIIGWGKNADGTPWLMPALEADWWRKWRHRDRDDAGARFRAGDLVRAMEAKFENHRLKIKSSRQSKRGGWEYVAETPPMLGVVASVTVHENDLAISA